MRPRGRRLLFQAVLLAAVLATGCRKSPEDWLDDLLHGDTFERQMAVTAIREVDDAMLRPAVRGLLAAMLDREHEVANAARESLLVVARRDIDGYLHVIGQVHHQGARWRQVSVLALRDLYPEARDRLWETLRDPADPVRELVGEIIRQEGPAEVERARAMLRQVGLEPPTALAE